MKRIIGIIIALPLLVVSCQKDEVEISPPAEMIGKWEWQYTHMGWEPGPMNPLTPNNTGNTEIIEFGTDFSWKSLINSEPVDSGTFKIGHGTYSPSEYIMYNFDSIQYYRNGEMVKGKVDYFEIYSDTLISCAGFKGIYGSSSKTYIKQ